MSGQYVREGLLAAAQYFLLQTYPNGMERRKKIDTSNLNAIISLLMLNDLLQDQAALYASGGMIAQERESFEILIEFHGELREFVDGLLEAGASLTLANSHGGNATVSPGLKARISGQIADRAQRRSPEGMVVSGADGLVHWVNPAFSAMCGYTLEELRGKNLGPILQGVDTDRATADRMRQAVHAYRPCCETILNYHKNGTPYWVEVAITPILNEAGEPLWLVARERELTDRVAA